MRSSRLLPLILTGAVGGAMLTGATASAFHAHAAKTTTLKYFFKSTGTRFTNAKGKKVSNPGVGDHLFATVNLYAGTAKHHAASSTGSAFAYCGITKLTKSTITGTCDAVVAIQGSMLTSISTQKLGAKVNVYPIVAGTGKYLHVKGGSVKTTAVGKAGDDNAVITIKG